METPEIIDFFRTPYFLFKADNGFSEKISEEVESILKDYKVGHINQDPKLGLNTCPIVLCLNLRITVG